jgi:hypothetical protein
LEIHQIAQWLARLLVQRTNLPKPRCKARFAGMLRVAHLATLILLVASLPLAAAGDKANIRDAIREVVVRENRSQQSPPASGGSFASQVADQVTNTASTSPKSRRDRSDDYRRIRSAYGRSGAAYCLSFLECPLGAYGAPTFEELRHHYRNYSDSEMWDMCLGRRPTAFAYGRDGACMLIASPSPWRPVDLPHNLEHGDVPPAEDSKPLAGAAEVPEKSPDEGVTCNVRDSAATPLNETLNRKRPPRDCSASSDTAE